MNRLRIVAVLISLGLYALAPPGVQAQTCDPRDAAPTYTVGSPSPIVCDTHGSQHVTITGSNGSVVSSATATASAPSYAEGATNVPLSTDLAGDQRVTIGTCLSGESACVGTSPSSYIMVQQRFSSSAVVVSDTQVKASAGFLHCITISQNDAAPTAGTIIVYDNTAESGTVVFNWTLTTAVFIPFQICPDAVMSTGIYIGFTTTADVNVSVSYQ